MHKSFDCVFAKGLRHLAALTAVASLVGCASVAKEQSRSIRDVSPSAALERAESTKISTEERVALYLHAASLTRPTEKNWNTEKSIAIYNRACAELTILLRSEEDGKYWNRTLQLPVDGGFSQLTMPPATGRDVWSPNEFTQFEVAADMPEGRVRTPDVRAGVGGALVGIRLADPREPFMLKKGLTAAVTATLEFQGDRAQLKLRNPTKQATVRLGDARLPLAADFSSVFAHYPKVNELALGLSETLNPGKYADIQGIYLLQPWDSTRIPIIFVHGLISTPYMWIDVINEIQADPVLRNRYQFLVYSYPSGNPLAYSALQFRQQLAKLQARFAMPNGFLLVGHSEGGLLSHMQTTTLTREDWVRKLGEPANELFKSLKPDSLIYRGLIFDANPKVKRVVFMNTPHRGSDMAISGFADFAKKLIRLPVALVGQLNNTVALLPILAEAGIAAGQLPTSVDSFSPKNPTLHVMNTKKVVPPAHSVIGNQGKPGPLAESSDGVVPYWSSHLEYAKSELIVPGPHGCFDYPQSVAELRRILHLHLGSSAAR